MPQHCSRSSWRGCFLCRGYADAYIDDIVVYSMNWKEHMGHISRVLEELKKVGMTAKPRKCCWGRRHIIYLGHIVGDGRLAVPEDRVVAMKEYITPVKKMELCSFLGGISYYRMFIENFANSSAVLSPATAKAALDPIQWTQPMFEAFSKLKCSLCKNVVLCVPCPSDIIVLCTDYSARGVGGVLCVQ